MSELRMRKQLKWSISSTKRSKGQKVCFVIQSDVLENSIDKDIRYEHTGIDKDIRYERTGQMGDGKYLRESYYHRIECSAANSLAALMRK